MAKIRRSPKRQIRTAPKKCYFHEEGKEPTFKDMAVLQRFLTERGKITARTRNGLCSKHQKELARQIKYARHLALLPFIVR
jgi:small subunit ribosomal protein S18